MPDSTEPIPGAAGAPHPDSIAARPTTSTGHVGQPTADSYKNVAATWELNPGADTANVSDSVQNVVKTLPPREIAPLPIPKRSPQEELERQERISRQQERHALHRSRFTKNTPDRQGAPLVPVGIIHKLRSIFNAIKG